MRKTRSKRAKQSEEPEATQQLLPTVKEEPSPETDFRKLAEASPQQLRTATVPETPEGDAADASSGEHPANLIQQDDTHIAQKDNEGIEADTADDIVVDISQATEPPDTTEEPEQRDADELQAEAGTQKLASPAAQTPHMQKRASSVKAQPSTITRRASSVLPKARISIQPGSSIAERRFAASLCFQVSGTNKDA